MATKKYNKKAYVNHMFRIHRNSALEEKIQAMFAEGGDSLNWLITKLLCAHFDVPIPHKVRYVTTRTPLVNDFSDVIDQPDRSD